MKIKLVQVGKSNKSYLRDSLPEFYKRIKKYCDIEEVVVKDQGGSGKTSADVVKKKEGELILKALDGQGYVVLLDEKGKDWNSRQLAGFVSERLMDGTKNLYFVVGGAFGFSDQVYQRANMKLRLSSMTFSHQLIRLILAEQLYRAFTIVNGHPYHND